MISMDQRESKGSITLLRMVMAHMEDQKGEEGLFLDLDQDPHLTSVSGCLTFNSFVLALPSE